MKKERAQSAASRYLINGAHKNRNTWRAAKISRHIFPRSDRKQLFVLKKPGFFKFMEKESSPLVDMAY